MSIDAGTRIDAQRQAAMEAARRAAEAARKAAAEAARRAQEAQNRNNNLASVKGDANLRQLFFQGKLRQAQTAPSPSDALTQINALPKPNPSDKTAVKDYKQMRAAIADNAIGNSQPPKIEDFRKNLNGATAGYEYREALTNHNAQIGELKKISTEAKTYPDKILSPYEAVEKINNLPRPDRANPQAIENYNRQRADIADAALMYAKPPTRDEFKGLPPRLADMEYRDALASYSDSLSRLKQSSQARYSLTPPPINDTEANKIADDLINRRGGVSGVSDGEARGIGKNIADLARTDPDAAIAVMNKVQEKLGKTDKGDSVADGFVAFSSIDELRKVSGLTGGKQMLENLQHHLLTGSVHDGERADAAKIDEAITGFNPNSLSGDPEKDAKTVDAQLKKLPPEMRDTYIQAVLENPFGQQAIKYAGAMSAEGAKLLGESLGKLYAKDPNGTTKLLRQITDSRDASLYPYYYQSGLAYAISKSGNDNLIKSFAQNEINRAKGNPDEVRGYLNAATAYAGLSPEALQNVMKNNPDFFKAVDEAGRLTDGPASSGGFENGNIWETGLGDLLEKASRIKDANGNATPEAIKLFETVVEHAGSNFRTMEGLGAFFVEHAQQLVDKYTDPTNENTPGSKVLENFFGSVIYSPIAKDLKYNGGSLVDAIMGNDKGEGGVIGRVVNKYISESSGKQKDDTDNYLRGERVGYLWNALSKGFLHGVQNYKDQWNDDKEFRDFMFDMVGKGLGKIADKFGLPGEAVDLPLAAVQNIFDAKAEKDKSKQLEKFTAAFDRLNDTMKTRLDRALSENHNLDGFPQGFNDAFGWQADKDLYHQAINE
ncbi:MAG: hypothetical protein ACR2HG_00755 [Pyrinomonadaceae bacterium]